ncbi:MAG: transposase [Bacteroidales bacterium]|nr:transposase [Bacteroidales bacterium]
MRNYKRRRFGDGECMHIYQRSVKGFNLFYDQEDFIVFYTIVSVLTKVYKVVLMEMCLMVDHVHLLVSSESLEEMSAFVRHYTSLYVMESNNDIGRKGPLFHKSFGSAPKVGSKKIRSAIVYVGNNPVEKKLCRYAEQYRWNFLAYMKDAAPFSTFIRYQDRSKSLCRALKEVRSMAAANKYLSHAHVRRLLGNFNGNEKDFLVDYIVSRFFSFDRDALLSYYESHDEMLHAMSSTAGSEYDIKETFHSGSDSVYADMADVVRNEFRIVPLRQVVVQSAENKLHIAGILKRKTSATKMQIAKFLHMDASGA